MSSLATRPIHALEFPDPPLGGGLADPPIVLRPWEDEDADSLVEAWSDPEILRWMAVPDDVGRSYAQQWIEGSTERLRLRLALDLAVVDAVDGRFLGEVGLSAFDDERRSAAIGWWTAASERGRGVASAMVRVLTYWAHHGPLELASIVAKVDLANNASLAVARNAGLIELGLDDDREQRRVLFVSGVDQSGRDTDARV